MRSCLTMQVVLTETHCIDKAVAHRLEAAVTESPEYPGAPRWVKIAGIVAAVVVVVLVIAALVGSGHGPQRHFGGHGDPTPSADAGR